VLHRRVHPLRLSRRWQFKIHVCTGRELHVYICDIRCDMHIRGGDAAPGLQCCQLGSRHVSEDCLQVLHLLEGQTTQGLVWCGTISSGPVPDLQFAYLLPEVENLDQVQTITTSFPGRGVLRILNQFRPFFVASSVCVGNLKPSGAASTVTCWMSTSHVNTNK